MGVPLENTKKIGKKYESSFLEIVTSDYEHPQAEKSSATNQRMDRFGALALTLACQTETDPAALYRTSLSPRQDPEHELED